MKHLANEFLIKSDKKFSLKHYDTAYTAGYDKASSKETLATLVEQTAELQGKLYAENRRAVLIIFQAMDAAGKDSVILHTMSGLNPQGCQVYSFKQPSAEEYSHDFLWRHYKALPERGRIGIHNRSHYENVLVTKVHPEYILKEHIPGIDSLDDIKHHFWQERYKSIRHFEKHLTDNGTVVIKFFLHLSKGEQLERFIKRLDDPTKNWKFAEGDLEERKLWKDYMNAYEEAIAETATENAPWYIIPADKKWFTRIAVSSVILHTLQQLDLGYPKVTDEQWAKFKHIEEQLKAEQIK